MVTAQFIAISEVQCSSGIGSVLMMLEPVAASVSGHFILKSESAKLKPTVIFGLLISIAGVSVMLAAKSGLFDSWTTGMPAVDPSSPAATHTDADELFFPYAFYVVLGAVSGCFFGFALTYGSMITEAEKEQQVEEQKQLAETHKQQKKEETLGEYGFHSYQSASYQTQHLDYDMYRPSSQSVSSRSPVYYRAHTSSMSANPTSNTTNEEYCLLNQYHFKYADDHNDVDTTTIDMDAANSASLYMRHTQNKCRNAFTIFIPSLSPKISPSPPAPVRVLGTCIFGVLMLLPFAYVFDHLKVIALTAMPPLMMSDVLSAPWSAWRVVLAMGCLGTAMPFILYFSLIPYLGPKVGIMGFVVPLMGVIIGIVFNNEWVGVSTTVRVLECAGGLVCVVGSVIVLYEEIMAADQVKEDDVTGAAATIETTKRERTTTDSLDRHKDNIHALPKTKRMDSLSSAGSYVDMEEGVTSAVASAMEAYNAQSSYACKQEIARDQNSVFQYMRNMNRGVAAL